MSEIELWADGSGTTSGPIGFAWALVHRPTGTVREGHAGALNGTNNRAELLAVIYGLRALKRPCAVTITTDSEYVGKAYPQGWVESWKRKNWRKVKNVDLWLALDKQVAAHDVSWRWVRGHTGVDLNESCDRRAGACRKAIIAALADGSPIAGLSFVVIDQPQSEQLALHG
jgi:ribonuclease HI